jgi:hypothetical protein
MNIEQQKEIATELLNKLELSDPYAILAGGAPRDWYFGNIARDLDFWMVMKYPVEVVKQILYKHGLEGLVFRWGDNIPHDYKLNPDIRCVVDAVYKGQAVQIVLVKNTTFGQVEKFPLSICQIWYKGGLAHATQAFKFSVKESVILKTNNIYGDGHKYITKILDKFPGFKYYKSAEAYLFEGVVWGADEN